MNEKQNKRKVANAMSKIVLHHPFFAMLLLNQELIYSDKVPTMATNGKCIMVNLDFVDKIDKDETIGILIHEIMHSVFYHITRIGTRDPKLWNMAGDYAINPIIKNEGFRLPSWVLDEDRFHGMTADAIYKILEEEQPEIPEELMDIIDEKLTEAERTKAEQENKVNITTAMNIAGDKVPDAIKKMVKDIVETKVNWQDKLRDFVQVSLGDDLSTWRRPNRSYLHDDLYIPSLEGRSMPNIAVLLDTSGSIYYQKELFNEFCSELNKIIEDMVPEVVDVFYVDTQVNKHDTFGEGELPEYELVGGGGTDFRSAWPEMEDTNPSCIIAFTDLWATLPDNSGVPTLWMVYENKSPEAPFGEITLVE